MADDIMEISSENGLHADEDVDFDFELTAPAGDEDAILEDADNTELGNNFNPQPSPSRGHDDLMIDEDDHHTFTMVDADLIHDDNDHNFEHETMSFASADAPLFDDANANTTYYEDGNEAITDSIDHGQQSSIIDYGLSDSRYESVQEELQVQENEANLESFETADEDTAKVHLEDAEQPASVVIPPDPPAAEEPQPPPAVEEENGATTNVPTLTDQSDQDHNSSADSPGNPSEEQSNAVDTEESSISTNEVIVFYQSNEYALFSTSELDDPDSFFLSDRSIIQKPLSELLNAIRGIIHEDLGDEDELCISFRDLDLETEEVSSILGDVTLAQISDLHEKLLINDGLELSPLHIELSIRKSFFKRLQNLTSGANEGKGISEFVSWSENSGSVDDSEELHTGNNEVEVSENSQPLDNLFDDEGHEGDAEDELVSQSNVQPEIAQEQEEHYDVTEAPSSHKLSSDSKVSILGSAVDSEDQETTQTETKILPEREKVLSGEFDEDGDIIDYSEDEFDDTEAKSRDPGQPTVLKADTTRTDNVAGYAAFNAREDLRRRSGSRVAEEDPEQITKPTEPTAANTDNHDVEREEDDGGYDEHNDEYDEQADPIRNDKDSTAADERDDGTDNHPESLHHFGDLGSEDENLVETHQELEQQETFDDLTGFAEYLGDETEETGPEQIPNPPEEAEEELRGIDAGPDESWDDHSITRTTGLAETAESSGTVSADEINFDEGQEEVFYDPTTTGEGQPSWDITDSINDHGQADEIDYEDEDEGEQPEEVPIQVNVITTPTQEITLINGKRPRAETESDDTLENKDAKRPRSR